jgi:hypothetical protein
MTIFLLLSVVDPAIAGLNEGRNAERKAFFTLTPDSDRNGKRFYQQPVQLVKPKRLNVGATIELF